LGVGRERDPGGEIEATMVILASTGGGGRGRVYDVEGKSNTRVVESEWGAEIQKGREGQKGNERRSGGLKERN